MVSVCWAKRKSPPRAARHGSRYRSAYTSRQVATRPLVPLRATACVRSLTCVNGKSPSSKGGTVYVGQLNVKGPGGRARVSALRCRRPAVLAPPRPDGAPRAGARGRPPAEADALDPHVLHALPDRRGLPRRRPSRARRQAASAPVALRGPAPHTRGPRVGRRRGAAARPAGRRRPGARPNEGRPCMEADAVDIQRIDVGRRHLGLGPGDADGRRGFRPRLRRGPGGPGPGASGPPPSRWAACSRSPRSCASAPHPPGCWRPGCWRCSASSR